MLIMISNWFFLQFDPGGEEDQARLLKLFAVAQTVMLVKGTQAELAEEHLAQMAEEEGKGSAKKGQQAITLMHWGPGQHFQMCFLEWKCNFD